MGFNCGIVGLPNVGKSTLFKAMTSKEVEASNYPFCTIEPNVGMVPLRDDRLYKLAELAESKKILPTAVEFVDIAGLVRGASKGEGLGNQFLSHIRSVDLVVQVVRCFEDPDIVHVDGRIDPIGDVETIETELMLADLDSVDRRLQKLEKGRKGGVKEDVAAYDLCSSVKAALEDGRPARTLGAMITGEPAVAELALITAKPVIYVANVGEDDLAGEAPGVVALKERAESEGAGFVALCVSIEAEIAELSEEERAEFLADLGLEGSGLDRLAANAHALLHLITYFTVGPKEARAWTVSKGTKAPGAAGVIHTDFEKGFIRAEVIACENFIELGSELACKEKGLMGLEGKDYVVADGDVMHFRFNV